MKNSKTFIYGLFEINNQNNIRYVGKSNDPEKRLKRHIQNTKYSIKKDKNITHKDRWLSKINFNVGYTILEECEKIEWQEKEIFHLNKYKNLTNTSKGGKGGSGIKYKLSYFDVKNWVKNFNIKSKNNWYSFLKSYKIPDFIPKTPREVFLNKGWVSWGDFLGTGKIANKFKHINNSI